MWILLHTGMRRIWKIWSFSPPIKNIVKLSFKTIWNYHTGPNCLAVWNLSVFPVLYLYSQNEMTNEPPCDKTDKVRVRPAKTQISLGICPVWSESSLSAWRKLGPLATHWVHSEDWSDWAGPRLIWVFAGRTATLLVLSGGGSNKNGA